VIRTLLVDDEPLARERLRSLVEAEAGFEVIGECGDGRTAVRAIEVLAPDLVLLDVQMPEMDGFQVLSALPRERLPQVVFVTAHDRYALKAFEVHALDYLLKPFDRERLRRALERARAQSGHWQQRLWALLDEVRPAPYLERLPVKSGGRVVFLRASEIDWIESAANYVRLHAGGKSHLLRETMKGIESQLDPRTFVRVHRSALVNLDRVQELQSGFHGDYVIVLRNGTTLPLGRTFRPRLESALGRRI